jgi:MFS family permease
MNDSGPLRSFRHRNFRIYYISTTLSNIGTWVQRIAQNWLVLELTNNALWLGIVVALQSAPSLFAFYGGTLADRFSKPRLLAITSFTGFVWAGLLGFLVVTNNVRLWHVLVISFGLGVTAAIDGPVRHAFLPELVPQEDVANSVALNSVNFNTARLIGPALSGFMIEAFDTGPAFLLNAISFLAVVLAVLMLDTSSLYRKAPRVDAVFSEALHYIRARPDLLAFMLVIFFFATFGVNPELFSAIMATKEFGLQAGEFGLLGSVIALGSLTATLFATKQEHGPGLRRVIKFAIFTGFALILSAFMPTYLLYAMALPIYGFGMLTTAVAANTTIQFATAPEVRGRVFGLYLAVWLGFAPGSAPLLGWITEHFGARAAVAFGGAVVILGVCAVAWRYRGRLDPPQDISIRE